MDKLKKCKLFLMVGIPGSGKTTWIQNHKNFFSNSIGIISRDEIRFSLLKENEEYFSKEKEVWKEYVSQSINSLKNNENTILDATHLNEGSRSKILIALKNYLKNVEINAIVLDTPLSQSIAQNKLRKGRSYVPLSVIRRMNYQMIIPTLEEGFDNIYIIYTDKLWKIITKEKEAN